ncbi:MAG: aminotransferase class IV [Bacteroidales bacterium]
MKIKIDKTERYYLHNSSVLTTEVAPPVIPEGSKVIYETIRVIRSKPLFINEHLERLEQSVKMSGFKFINAAELSSNIDKLLESNPVNEKNLKLTLWSNKNGENEILAYFIESKYPTAEDYNQGINVELLPMERNNPNVKLENPNLRASADKVICLSQTTEVLLINSKGFITEGSRSNFFAVFGNTVVTPPNQDVLEGITRNIIIALAKENGIWCIQKSVHINEIPKMKGAFITGTSAKVLPINRIGDTEFENISSIIRKLMIAYDDLILQIVSN